MRKMNMMETIRNAAKGRENWVEKKDAIIRLLKNQEYGADRIILLASSAIENTILIKGAVCKERHWKTMREDEKHEWDGTSSRPPVWCGLVSGGGEPDRIEYGSQPIKVGGRDIQNRSIEATALVADRSFEGKIGRKDSLELWQDLEWAHGLHWMRERKAWCRLDNKGDIAEIVKICEREEERKHYMKHSTIVHADSEIMEMQMVSKGEVLLLVFDCCWMKEGFHSWMNQEEESRIDADAGLYYIEHREENQGWIRGIKVVKSHNNKYSLALQINSKNEEEKYAEFIVEDWRHERLTTTTIGPRDITSYFEGAEGKPYHISPVYFRGEVLDKYRNDREKYTLGSDSIGCRNAWYLWPWRVNDAGQIFTYAIYLSRLPYEEQLHWEQYNEKPKGDLPERIVRTDFLAQWGEVEPGIEQLKATIRKICKKDSNWFHAQIDELDEALQYPLGPSLDVWAECISRMQTVVCEGLVQRELKKMYLDADRNYHRKDGQKWGSIKWAEEALVGAGMERTEAKNAVQPLRDLQAMRNWMSSAHKRGQSWGKKVTDLLEEYGSPIKHVENMAERCREALELLDERLNER